ncbi:amino acid ABC transporter permease [Angustibacter peucedani]
MTERPTSTPGAGDRPGAIDAVPVRHVGRWVAVAVIAVLAAMLLHLLLANKAFNWHFVFQAMIQSPVIDGLLRGTLVATVGSMVVGVLLGVVLAVMRLSPNKVLSWSAWTFTWFFRAIPRYVLLFIIGNLAIVLPRLDIGIPFDWVITDLIGLDQDFRFLGFNTQQLGTSVAGGILGLGLSEAAYMAEIARAGILSVDRGQEEAAQALGMSRGKTMRRVVLPQAMRVIVPPTGNETIAMLKDTSLLIALPLSYELFFQLRSIGSRTFQVFPVAVAATLWYLILCSVLMVGQYFLERRFGRGFGSKAAPTKTPAALTTAGQGGR